MRIVTLAPDSALGRLRPHIGADTLVDVDTVEQLQSALRAGAVRWAVIDPMALSERTFRTAIDSIAVSGVRLVFFSRLAGFDHSRIVAAHAHVLPEVVFHETDDDWRRMAAVFRGGGDSVAARVLVAVALRACALNGALRDRTMALFASAPVPDSVDAFASAARTTSAGVRSKFQRVGLAPPNDLLCVARLSRWYRDLVNRSIPLETVVEVNGLGTVRTLERRLRSFTALAPRAVGHACDKAEFVRRLSAAVLL